jgi:hypothetical protein
VPGLPFQLYSFRIVDFDDDGEVRNAFEAGDEVHYAFIINQPVEVQREAALWFLYEAVFRQAALRSPDADGNQADVLAARASEQARSEFSFRIRSGWREAAKSLASRASHEGLHLRVRYQPDPFPDRAAIVRRMRALRDTYNSIGLAAEFVDKMVSLIGGRDPRVVVGPGNADVRELLERQMLDLGLRHIIAQTTRDALVLGNGYVVFPEDVEDGPFNLRPESVQITDGGQFAVLGADGAEQERFGERVLHLRGVEQLNCPYGFSVLEVILPEWDSRRTLQRVLAQTETLMAQIAPTQEQIDYLNGVRGLVERHEEASNERLNKLLWYPRDWVPDAVEGLYLPGQTRL